MSKKPKEFIPSTHNPLPWRVMSNDGRCGIWTGVLDANGKRVCNCRNIKDAELIVKAVNTLTANSQIGAIKNSTNFK